MGEAGLLCMQSDVHIDRTKIQEGWKDLMAMRPILHHFIRKMEGKAALSEAMKHLNGRRRDNGLICWSSHHLSCGAHEKIYPPCQPQRFSLSSGTR